MPRSLRGKGIRRKEKAVNEQKRTSAVAFRQGDRSETPLGAPKSAKTQRARILRVMVEARGAWIPLPRILELGIAQYGARILELRRVGFVIENKTEHVNGARHSWFRLVNSPAPCADQDPKPAQCAPVSNLDDWYESTAGKPRPDGTASSDELPLFATVRR